MKDKSAEIPKNGAMNNERGPPLKKIRFFSTAAGRGDVDVKLNGLRVEVFQQPRLTNNKL
jgi:hypothetical protein